MAIQMTILQMAVLLAFACCIISFTWGMTRFFRTVGRFSLGTRIVQVAVIMFTLAHLIALSRSHAVSMTLGVGALGLYCVSLVLFWSSIRVNRAKPLSAVFSKDHPEHLITRGPYRFIRNPFYSSYLSASLGGTIASAQPWLLLSVLIMAVIYY